MDSPPPRNRSCFQVFTTGCILLTVVLALLVCLLVWLVKFVWGLRLDQWL